MARKHYLLPLVLLAVSASSARADSPSYSSASERIRSAVMEEIARDPGFGRYEIEFEVRQGSITLDGTVSSERAKSFVERAVLGQRGVETVFNRLRVESSAASVPPQKGGLAGAVAEALKSAGLVEGKGITVRTSGNAVTLTGEVLSASARRRSSEIARAVPGVSEVENQLEVAVSTPQTGEKRVRAALEQNYPELARTVTVTAIGGVITLQGNLPTHREVDAVLSSAVMAAGGDEVKSNLTVAGKPYPRGN